MHVASIVNLLYVQRHVHMYAAPTIKLITVHVGTSICIILNILFTCWYTHTHTLLYVQVKFRTWHAPVICALVPANTPWYSRQNITRMWMQQTQFGSYVCFTYICTLHANLRVTHEYELNWI